ncbi:MAG TPA: hypothetical protein VIU65_00160 [Pyrinomonadaceae bacterium]
MSNRTESASQTNRRGFIKSASAAALITITPTAISNCYADQVGVSGDFDFSWKNGKLHVKAKDVLINGLTIPKFTWGWIGLGIAEGVLSALGGAIFGALANAIFGSGKSMEQLLKEQLAEIARIVEEKLQENDLRNYQAKVGGFVTLFREYNNNPTMSRLNYLTNESAPLLSEIESLGFKGYRTYMTTAGLRLSVLQQQIKKSNTAGNRANFADQRDVSMEFHNEMQALIDERSDVNYYVKQLLDWLKGQDFPFKEDLKKSFAKVTSQFRFLSWALNQRRCL